MQYARQTHKCDVLPSKHVVHEETGDIRMCAMMTVRPPARDWRFRPPAELGIRFIEWAPYFTLAAHLQLEQLSQVMAERGNERCVLPARAVVGTTEAIDTTVWPP